MTKTRKFVLLFAALLGATIALAGAAQAKTCHLMKMAGFDISSQPGAPVTIPVTINGTAEHFLIDTGGVYSIISPAVTTALKLEPHTISRRFGLYLADGTRLNHYVSVDRLGIGSVNASDVHLFIGPQASQTGLEHYQGTLSSDFLYNFDLDFDFGHHTLNLFSQDHCDGRVVYWASQFAAIPIRLDPNSNHIELPVDLDGHNFTAVLDTGASHTLLSAKAAYRAFGLKDGGPGMEPIKGMSQNAIIRYMHRFKVLSLNGVAVRNPQIGILHDDAERSFWKRHGTKDDRDPVYGLTFHAPKIILGMDVLRALHLYIAYKEKKLYVTTASA